MGRLGDLGSIDPKYDIAVSSAAPSLDNFVAHTVQQAEDLLAFGRSKGLGKITVKAL